MRQNSKPVYVVTGEALDKETIVRLRQKIEDYVKIDLGKKFTRTKLYSSLNQKEQFDFKLEFYG